MAGIGRSSARVAAVTDAAPHLRGPWDNDRMTFIFALALAPPLARAAYQAPAAVLSLTALSLAVVLVWQGLFAFARGRALRADGIVTAVSFALMAPIATPAWHLVLGLSFGVVIGEQIFGGRGRNFLHPGIVALSFLILSFPDGGYDFGGSALAYASLPGGLLLMATGLISWRVVVAATTSLLAVGYMLGVGDPIGQLVSGGFVFALIFLACDPVASASTNPGRWIYGLMVGGLVALGRGGAGDGVVMATLLASVFAPLIDQAVIAVNVAMRRRRYG
jgi:Na+-transporting NADH:ubiquinone oxidoreductase subunit B